MGDARALESVVSPTIDLKGPCEFQCSGNAGPSQGVKPLPARRRAHDDRMTIGELARTTGTKVETIRYYESVGLLPNPARSPGNQRLYTKALLDRLGFILHSRDLGFRLADIRQLLALIDYPDRSCTEADAIAKRHLRGIQSRITRLEALKLELERMVTECQHGRIGDCRVIEVLANHKNCLHDDHVGAELD